MNKPFHISELNIGQWKFVPFEEGAKITVYITGKEGDIFFGTFDETNPLHVLVHTVLGQAEITWKQSLPQPGPIIQEWCHHLGLRHQGTLMGAIRGCDGTPKEDPSKWIVRFLRACVLRAHVGDPRRAVSFMEWTDSEEIFKGYAKGFLSDFDRYPTHYTFHLLHASAILAHYYPNNPQKRWWEWFHQTFCKKLHVHPESQEEMDNRLNKGEKEFGKDQKL